MEGKNYIQKLKRIWICTSLLQCLCVTFGASLFFAPILRWLLDVGLWIYPFIFIISAAIFLVFRPIWKISNLTVVRYLDQNFPELEDSTSLFLKPTENLGVLAQFQISKINNRLPKNFWSRNVIKMLGFSVAFLLLGVFTYAWTSRFETNSLIATKEKLTTEKTQNKIIEHILPQVSDYTVRISPPAYTALPARKQKQFYVKAELGATVTWNLVTNTKIKSFSVIFNDQEKLKLKPENADANRWTFSRKIEKHGYYQLELDGVKSDLYQIDAIPDLPVNIKIIHPKPQTTIDVGQPKTIDIQAILTDDYGITASYISATMASGKGESVSFTEKKLEFQTAINGQKTVKLNKHIDLKSLGMKAGDELYFFIHSKDNKGQQSRSDVYFVSIIDTAELMSMAGMTSGVNLVPEYFRSERQIIIDTEKLLTEQKSISVTDFNSRSNALGVDQKLLRLRYGQFLGEENETEIGGDDHDEHEHAEHHEEEKFGNVQAIMDKYAHKHDIAEDATFFEPEIKAQLKAVLNEMWQAELKLRTYKPQDALPFEYKALRLLKDLQQKSRAYVAKTTVKTSTLKPEKRLSGDLNKITEPSQNLRNETKNENKIALKILLAVLDTHRSGRAFNENEKALLQTGEKEIIKAAVDHPATYLDALKSLRKIISQKNPKKQDLVAVSSAIFKLIGEPAAKPFPEETGTTKKLSNAYFNNLNNH
ncbi:hypothetical protein ACJVDH_12555 [Pedobacter sp. AW1-32]|uniref:hypothetical protein n=1 Tax=Pedobacter sp. AW1-32 TaxID=3383026 RepID=UPI003FEE5202